MSFATRLARGYWRWNERVWLALKGLGPVVQYLVVIGVCLGWTVLFSFNGQPVAAWGVTLLLALVTPVFVASMGRARR